MADIDDKDHYLLHLCAIRDSKSVSAAVAKRAADLVTKLEAAEIRGSVIEYLGADAQGAEKSERPMWALIDAVENG